MSRSLESPSVIKKLHSVAQELSNTQERATRANIDEWLDEHSQCYDNLYQFMESGLLIEMITKDLLRKLPRSCTRLTLVPDTIRRRVLIRANPTLTANILKAAKEKDIKIKDRLFLFGMCTPNCEALRGGISENDFIKGCDHKLGICGSRLQEVSVGPEGHIDWTVCGVYVFVKASGPQGSSTTERFDQVHDADKPSATHIMHRFAKKTISLETLGIPRINETWTIEHNWDDKSAQLISGKRFRVDLWEDFKTDKYLNYAERLSKKFEQSPYLAYFGVDARKKAKEEREVAEVAAAAATRTAKQAGLPSGMAPVRRRRRLTTT